MKFLLVVASFLGAGTVMATPEPNYDVVAQVGAIEVREYAPVMVAEVVTDSGQNGAFRLLFNYITGANTGAQKIAMTAPVLQAPALQEDVAPKVGQNIPMTAPVLQAEVTGGKRMTFFLPPEFTPENTPVPSDARVTIRQEGAQRIAAIQFSGYMNEAKVEKQAAKLALFLNEQSIPYAEPYFTAGYNAPWTPWFMRRNEVMYRLK